jgi:hypothetical protein
MCDALTSMFALTGCQVYCGVQQHGKGPGEGEGSTMSAEGAALQAWFDQSVSHMAARVGKGRASHWSPGNDETLCGKMISTYVSLADAQDMRNVCGPCHKKAIKLGTALLNALPLAGETGEKEEMAAKKTAEAAPEATEAPELTQDQIKEELTNLVERITTVAIAGDDTAERVKEGESLVYALKGGSAAETKKIRAEWLAKIRDAAGTGAAKAAVITKVTKRSDVGLGSQEYPEHVKELIKTGAGRLAEGIQLQQKTTDVASSVASTSLEIAKELRNKDGDPDLDLNSGAGRSSMSDMIAAAMEALGYKRGEDAPDEIKEASSKLARSIQYQRTHLRVLYIRSLDTSPEEAAKFARIAGLHPDAPVSEAVFTHYVIAPQSELEKQRERNKAKTLAAAKGKEAIATSGGAGGEGGEGGEGEGDGGAVEHKPRAVTWIEKADEAVDKSDENLKSLDDSGKSALRMKIMDLENKLADLRKKL